MIHVANFFAIEANVFSFALLYLNEFKTTARNYRSTQAKHRKAKKGHGWTKLESIEMDCIWVNLKNVGPSFFQIYCMSVYKCIKMSFTLLENHSQLLCGHDFANERLLVCQFDV